MFLAIPHYREQGLNVATPKREVDVAIAPKSRFSETRTPARLKSWS